MDETTIPANAGSAEIVPAPEQAPEPVPAKTGLQADTLRLLAGLAGESATGELSEFLSGRGSLVESTRLALAGGKKKATNELAELLEKQFKMAPAAAAVVAGLLVKLFPSISKIAGAAEPAKKKTRRKTKPKTSAAAKKKKAAVKKKAAAKKKPAVKKKTSATSKKTAKKVRK